MPLILFSFAIDTETNTATISGSVSPREALHLLQDLIVSNVIREQLEAGNPPVPFEEHKGG